MQCSPRPLSTLVYLVEHISIHFPARARLSVPSHLSKVQRFSTAQVLHHELGLDSEALPNVTIRDRRDRKDPGKKSSTRTGTNGPLKRRSSLKREENSIKKHGESDAAQVERMKGAPSSQIPRNIEKKGRLQPNTNDIKPRPKQEYWGIQKSALESKFGPSPWTPRKRLSPDTLDGIRAMHSSDPDKYTTPILADHFKVSPEAIRRILKSKWRPKADEMEDRRVRWEKRGEKIWSQLAEIGTRPPKKWREMGVGKAEVGEVPRWKGRGGKGGGRPVGKPVDIAVSDVVAERRAGGKERETFSDRML